MNGHDHCEVRHKKESVFTGIPVKVKSIVQQTYIVLARCIVLQENPCARLRSHLPPTVTMNVPHEGRRHIVAMDSNFRSG